MKTGMGKEDAMNDMERIDMILDDALNDATWTLPTVVGAVAVDRAKLRTIREDAKQQLVSIFTKREREVVRSYIKVFLDACEEHNGIRQCKNCGLHDI